MDVEGAGGATDPAVPAAAPVAAFYFLYYAALGVLLPFLPAYLKSLSLSATEVGILLALQPLLALGAPHFWARLADRTGKPGQVLSVICAGLAICFTPLLVLTSFPTLFLTLLVFSVFASSLTTLLDTIALRRVATVGGSYARLRLFGSVGFVLTSAGFGLWVDTFDRRVIVVPLVLMLAYFACSFALHGSGAPAPAKRAPGQKLLSDRVLFAFLAAASLHWIAGSPFHAMFAVHVASLGLPPSVVGLGAGLGVLAEVAIMWWYPRVAHRFAPLRFVTLAYAVSVVRWAGMAIANDSFSIVALSLLHAFSFGAFLVGGVAFVASRVPSAQRASGQALFVSATFGLGGLVGFASAGVGFDLLGGHRLFGVAAIVELAALLILLRLRPSMKGASSAMPLRK